MRPSGSARPPATRGPGRGREGGRCRKPRDIAPKTERKGKGGRVIGGRETKNAVYKYLQVTYIIQVKL